MVAVPAETYCRFMVRTQETLICKRDADVVGLACFSEIVPGRSATFLGWIAPGAREGFGNQKMMRSFLHDDVLGYAWNTLKLIRLEARCHPGNHAAVSLLKNAGFRMVGTCQADLLLHGQLCATLLWELVNPAVVIDDEDGLPETTREIEEIEEHHGSAEAEDEFDDAVDFDEPTTVSPADLSDNEFARLYGAPGARR